MNKEQRYVVLKMSDIEEFLNESQKIQLSNICFRVEQSRLLHKKESLKAVVVEHDWPEYEPTWDAIEARINAEDINNTTESVEEK